MGEDIKAVITDHRFIHAWFIIVGILSGVVLAAVLALLTKSVMNVVETVLAVLTPVELEHESAGGRDDHKENDAEEQDQDKEEIAKLKRTIQKQAIALKESERMCKEQELIIDCMGQELIIEKIEVRELKGIIQQQEVTLQENTETIVAKTEDLARAKSEVKKLKTLLQKASAMKTGVALLSGARLDAKYERRKCVQRKWSKGKQ